MVPHTAAGIALLGIFGRNFFAGKFFSRFGIAFVGAEPGIVIAMMFVSVPILVNAVREGFSAIDPRIEHVAQTLVASSWKLFCWGDWEIPSHPKISDDPITGSVPEPRSLLAWSD